MPAVRPTDEERRTRRERRTYLPVRYQPACPFIRGTEERIRRTADSKPAAIRLGEEIAPLRDGRRDRLLGVDVLAGLERGADHGGVCGRRREIQHHVDRRICDQLVDGRHRQAVYVRECLCALQVEVGAGDDLERLERS